MPRQKLDANRVRIWAKVMHYTVPAMAELCEHYGLEQGQLIDMLVRDRMRDLGRPIEASPEQEVP